MIISYRMPSRYIIIYNMNTAVFPTVDFSADAASTRGDGPPPTPLDPNLQLRSSAYN